MASKLGVVSVVSVEGHFVVLQQSLLGPCNVILTHDDIGETCLAGLTQVGPQAVDGGKDAKGNGGADQHEDLGRHDCLFSQVSAGWAVYLSAASKQLRLTWRSRIQDKLFIENTRPYHEGTSG